MTPDKPLQTDPEKIAAGLTEARRDDGKRYLLVKRGLYYRPGNCGYTGIKDNAGRYDASEARPAAGVKAIHEDNAPLYAPSCFHDLAAEHFANKVREHAATAGPELERYADALAALLAGFPDGHGLLENRHEG